MKQPAAQPASGAIAMHIASGVPNQAAPLALRQILEDKDTFTLVHVVQHDRRASEMVATLPFFFKNTEIIYFPAWDVLPYDRVSPNPSIVTERLNALVELMRDDVPRRIVVTTAAAFSQLLPPKDILQHHIHTIQQGGQINREALMTWLVEHGYQANSKAVESGEFAIRGSIIDIVPAGLEVGYRIDLFGDEVEHIKQFDPLTQRSEQKVEVLKLLPASEVLLTKEHIEIFRRAYRDAFGAINKHDPLYEAISSGTRYPGMEHWLPLFYSGLSTLADYTGNDTILTMESGINEVLAERQEVISEAYSARLEAMKMKQLNVEPYKPLSPSQLYLSADLPRLYAYQQQIQFTPFIREKKSAIYHFQYISPHVNFSDGKSNPFDVLKGRLASKAYAEKNTLICCYSIGSRERLIEMLANHGMQAERAESYKGFLALKTSSIAVAHVPMSQGVETEQALIISEEELLGERLIRTKRKKRDADYFMAEAATFEPGELVVHKEHGIGRFDSLETISAGGADHDCLKIVYADDDRLFVPVENIDVVSRYGTDEEGVQMDRLGASSWQARKAKLKERIGIIAEGLMQTAAERLLKPGEKFEAQRQGYEEFAARFGFVETEDQASSIEAVEQDLLSGKPMDRLVCGDVGFGKTEVALRAAYIVVSNKAAESGSHQVALIVPTTLLARQHYQNFKARFAGFGVNVRQLSRMVSAKESKLVKAGLAGGSVDIVIGTHALLAKDLAFKNLGLIIVDEEQRFGVAQKEKLKALKSDVHVLTLTATPIPRTLQLSLAGVRDLSLITTPPVDRLAVRTFVMPFDPVVLREALMREKNRGGGSFIVTPRIADIGELKAHIKQLVPELHIEVAHGQMSPADLDELMNRFYDQKIDVLISTTIIESGLDVPHANTMIIHKADRFGLAQLYQLRGRVGRSKTRAYAYLLLPHGKTLGREATRRLEVMQTLDRLGAGFQLASHDMDIRGFGNLVGDEQSGHIREVGVELYQQMLNEAIEKLKAQKIPSARGGPNESAAAKYTLTGAYTPDGDGVSEDLSPQINLGLSVLIPEYYVEDLSLRMGLYRRIGNAANEAELESLAAEMIDRFGELPEEVGSLFTTMRFKWWCKQLCIARLDAGPKGVVLHFASLSEARASKLIAFLGRYPTKVKMRPDQSVFIAAEYNTNPQKISGVESWLKLLADEMQIEI